MEEPSRSGSQVVDEEREDKDWERRGFLLSTHITYAYFERTFELLNITYA
jgi:hypothetical protein